MDERLATSLSAARKIKICFLSLYSYPLFNPACISPFGGSEVRISLIAKELARYADLDVHLVVFDHGQARGMGCQGVTIHPWIARRCPLRVDNPWAGAHLQFGPIMGLGALSAAQRQPSNFQALAPMPLCLKARLYLKAHSPRRLVDLMAKLRYLFAAFKSNAKQAATYLRGENLFGSIHSHAIRNADVGIYDDIDADIYVAHGNHDLTAILSYYCRRRGKRFVMVSGSDQDFIAAHRARRGSTDIYGQLGFLLAYTIENAALLIVQTEHQAELARNLFGKEAVVIPNPVDLAPRFFRNSRPERVLWIGKSDDRVKQPELFVNLAQRKPEYRYVMIMNLMIDNVHRRILRMSQGLLNLEILSYIPYSQSEEYFADAKLLVNTSSFEGFPDTFLQAAKYGVPVVSLQVDPNRMLTEHGCGLVSGGDFNRLVENVSLLMSDDQRYIQASINSRAYLAGHHDKEVLIPKYREALLHLL